MKKQVVIIGCVGVAIFGLAYKRHLVIDVSRLSPVVVASVKIPHTVDELIAIIRTSDTPISFAGGKFSQGGQVAYPGGTVIDITHLNNIVAFDLDKKTITVQPGIRWRDIQQYIDPHNLSVKVMQSYNDFTVGGSLSVNVHGRDPLGSLIKTVLSVKIVMPDGSVKTASRHEHSDLFAAALGGYGLLGPIIEVTLQLTDNQKIERVIKVMSLSNYCHYVAKHIYHNPRVVFHNANLYPDDFEDVLAVTWYATDKPLTIQDRLQKKGLYIKEKLEEQLLRRVSSLKKLRQIIEPERLKKAEVVWRNYEMSYSVDSLEPLVRFPTSSILQEYFVPLHAIEPFIKMFKAIAHEHGVNMLNVSIRFVPADKETVLSYAPHDVYALVCYINVPRSFSQQKERAWTQALIDAVLSHGGTFYLPYHLYATPKQFKKAYPRFNEFLAIKKRYDPQEHFANSLSKRYLDI